MTFDGDAPFAAEDVAVPKARAVDPNLGKNVRPSMAIVEGGTVNGAHSITMTVGTAVLVRQILDLLQISIPIVAAGSPRSRPSRPAPAPSG